MGDIPLEPKPWYQSKAKIGAILLAVAGVVTPISTALGHPIEVPDWVYKALGGFTAYGVRDAINK